MPLINCEINPILTWSKNDDFAICQNAHMDMCLCCRADV